MRVKEREGWTSQATPRPQFPFSGHMDSDSCTFETKDPSQAPIGT
jgi:hypothetical protein